MCRRCNGEVIARCGTRRVAHWAHRGMRDCDTWAEKETDWHRAWKNNFPAECQEFIQHDGQSGEKHIADVRTPHGLVIEFQHSHLDPLERAARERFYGNVVWVVDGTRLQRDYPRFARGKDDLRRTRLQPDQIKDSNAVATTGSAGLEQVSILVSCASLIAPTHSRRAPRTSAISGSADAVWASFMFFDSGG